MRHAVRIIKAYHIEPASQPATEISMSTYVIGDVQGCYAELQKLLQHINYDPRRDILWCTGDLINRGPQSLEVLRFFYELGDRTRVVLGNHDLHLLAVAHGNTSHIHPSDTLAAILHAPDRNDLLYWLRHQPLLHHDDGFNITMIHAGLPPQWDLAQAQACADEVEAVLQGSEYGRFLAHIYGNKPKKWSEELSDYERLRFITNCFTRLRYCNAEGKLSLKKKSAPTSANDSAEIDLPWFKHPHRASRDNCIVFGHWSTLGLHVDDNVYGIDTGCLWGGELTALRLDDLTLFNIPCPGACEPDVKKTSQL